MIRHIRRGTILPCAVLNLELACRWGITVTLLYPALAASIWFACIKTGNPQDDFGDKAVWLFLVNPVTGAFLSFLTLMLFFTALSKDNPWRPLKSYIHILVAVYVAQVRLLLPCCNAHGAAC
jgi:hypothetical protein